MSIAGHCKPFFRGGAAREEFGGILDSAISSLLGTLSGSFGGFLVKIRILKKALIFFRKPVEISKELAGKSEKRLVNRWFATSKSFFSLSKCEKLFLTWEFSIHISSVTYTKILFADMFNMFNVSKSK